MEIDITENPTYRGWNFVLDKSTQGNYQQTFEYGEVIKKAHPRTRVMRLSALVNDNPIGVVQGIYRTRFFLGSQMIVGGVSGGAPLTSLKNPEEKMIVTESLLRNLEKYARKNRVIEARIYWTAKWGMWEIFDKLGYKIARQIDVFTVNLRKTPEELWSSIAHNMRRKVKQAVKSDVKVEEAKNREDLQTFYFMLAASGKRAGFNPPPMEEFSAEWKIFGARNMVKLFLAKLEEKPVAGAFILTHRKTMYATAAGSQKWAWRTRPNDYLHWKIIEWGSQHGFHYYCMGSGLTPGISRWKKEYGGNLVRIYNFDKVFFPKMKKASSMIYGTLLALRRQIG